MVETITDIAGGEAPPARRLMDSAIGLLHQHAYHSIGVQMLCDAAAVSKGSFYHFFPSKEGLVLAAVEDAWADFIERVLDPAMAVDPRPDAIRLAVLRSCLGDDAHPPLADEAPHACMFTRLAAGIDGTEAALRHRLGEIFTEWVELMGGGEGGRRTLALIQGDLVLAMVHVTSNAEEA